MLAALDSVLELLLKYRPALFAQGRLAFDAPTGVAVGLGVAGVALAALVAWTYAQARGGATPRDRTLLTVLRVAALAVLTVCLLRPVLVLAAAAPRRNTVAVLIDDSRSMRLADWGGRPRAEAAARLFASDAALRRALDAQFAVRTYRFADVAARTDSVRGLSFAGDRTRVGAALDRVREELEGVPLAGVVVLTDGADGAPTPLGDALLALRARGTPVFTVGVGAAASTRDVEVARVEAPRSVLQGSALPVQVVLTHRGLAGTRVPVTVEENGRVVARTEVTLPDAGDALPVRLSVPAQDAGARRLTVRVPRQSGEVVGENNERPLLVDVRDAPERVLYFEGEPRFEAKFLRRAIVDDDRLQLTVLQRTAEGKYLRLGVSDSLDLVSGFPTTREALFAYRAIVIGSVEASAFTAEQLRLLADFVGVRGGGLLFLGGRRAFAEGGYAGTPLEEVMPVVLSGGRGVTADDEPVPAVELAVRPTSAGVAHAPLQLAGDERASAARWAALPPLTAVNTVRAVRPGATVLLTGTAPNGGGSRVVMASQRYGRGKAAALAVQDSWLWQMHAAITPEDQTHETFWRQTLRWLAADVPGAIELTAAIDRPAPGEAVALHALVRDSVYAPVNGATVVAEVTAPSGTRREVPLEWGVTRDGEYNGTFTATEAGMHAVRVLRREPGREQASAITYLDAAPSREEYFAAGLRAELLRRLASETGGKYYTPETAGALAEDLRYARAGVTVAERKELWDMPATFLLLGALLAGEWGYRRRRGLA
jgi:uncharacterized membrane protein